MTVLPRWLRTTRDLRVGGLVLAGLALFIAVVYVVIVLGGGLLIGETDKANIWLSVLATLIAALGSEPLGDWLDTKVTRLVYAGRPSPYEVLRGFTHEGRRHRQPRRGAGQDGASAGRGDRRRMDAGVAPGRGRSAAGSDVAAGRAGCERRGRQARSSSPGRREEPIVWPGRRSASCASKSLRDSP